jgi:hypothetical protein
LGENGERRMSEYGKNLSFEKGCLPGALVHAINPAMQDGQVKGLQRIAIWEKSMRCYLKNYYK